MQWPDLAAVGVPGELEVDACGWRPVDELGLVRQEQDGQCGVGARQQQHPARWHHTAAIWAGIDAGRTHHHCVAIDEGGRRLLSRRVTNDEHELLELLGDVLALSDEVVWGIDLADGGAAFGHRLDYEQRSNTFCPMSKTAVPGLQH